MRPSCLSLIALMLVGPIWTAPVAAQEIGDAAYEAGTDSAMHYLVKYGVALRVTLLLQECGLNDLASKAGAALPKSVDWFKGSKEAAALPADQVAAAAQIARGYLVGFEAGTRLEFQQGPDEWKLTTCNAAAAAAK